MTARDRIVVMVVLVAVALAGFWFLLLAPKRTKASDLGAQVAEQQQRLETAKQSVQASRQAQATYAANYATVAQLGKAVPVDDDVPSLVYQLDSTAEDTGVDFRVVKLSASGATPAPAPTPTPAPGASGSASASSAPAASSSSSAPATASTPAPATQTASAGLPPGAVVGPAGFPTMPFSFTFEGSFFRLSEFFGDLEGYIGTRRGALEVSGRLLTVDGFSLKAADEGFPRMTAIVSATAYILPASEGLTAGATPAGPAQGGTQPVSGSTPAAPAPATAQVTP